MIESEYNIRDASLNDLDSIYRIEVKSFPDPYPKGLLKAFFFIPGTIIVGEISGKVVGYAIGIVREDKIGHIVSIAVEPEMRRKRIGEALLKELIKKFELMKMKKVVLEVRKSNLAAKALYQRLGFEKKEEIEGYYQDGESAEIMELPLSDRRIPLC